MDPNAFTDGASRWAFVSPSGNINCAIDPDLESPDKVVGLLGCQAWDSVEGSTGVVCGNSPSSTTYAISVTPNEVRQYCEHQGAYVSNQDPRPVLDYGQVLTVGDYTCTSEEVGVTCRGPGGGVLISRDTNTILG